MVSKLSAIILGLIVLNAYAEPDKFIRECFDCHGQNGVSPYEDMPTIAGLSAVYLEDSMYAYLDETRPARVVPFMAGDTKRPVTDMTAITKSLKEKQFKAIADYFSAQTFVPAKQKFDPELAKTGKKIHQKQCERCHEAAGTIAADDAGILSGQWMAYMQQTFTEYRDGGRRGNKKMIKLMKKLSSDDIKALLHYYASGKP